MAEAATTVTAEDGKGKGGDGHTLSQSEIDSLLGFQGGGGEGGGGGGAGLRALLDKSVKSYERLPVLEVIFSRFAQALGGSLENFLSEQVDVTIDSMTSLRFEDYLQSIPMPTLIMIFQAVEWENQGLITLDGALCYSMVDRLLGGGKSAQPPRVENRPFTAIEQEVLKSFGALMLENLGTSFAALTPATFRMERVEIAPKQANITRPANAVVLLALRLDMKDRGGRAEVLIPYATLEPVKDLLMQVLSGESFGADPSWEDHFASEIANAPVRLEARLSPRRISLREAASLQVGATVLMNEAPNDEVAVTCKGIPMFSGRLGKKGVNVALRISDVFNKNMKDLL